MTADAMHVRLMRPVRGVVLSDEVPDPVSSGAPFPGDAGPLPEDTPVAAPAVAAEYLADLERQQEQVLQTQAVLDDLVQKLTQMQEDMLSTHGKEIARLAVEIARKVLMQEVRDGDYEIEKIIQEALKNAPVEQDVVVHLHPDDLVRCQSIQQENPEAALTRLTLVADTAIGKAECQIKTPKGIVKSFIDNHLDKIREALERAN